MNHLPRIARAGALLATNLLFISVWGFAGISKLMNGKPSWFPDKFGKTFLSSFPGLTATFWLLAVSELLALTLAVVALMRAEFLERKPVTILPAMLAWSLFVFVQLGFGQWLTNDFNGAFQQFAYFSGTLLALHFVMNPSPGGSLPDH
jgi:predicted small integral membrane protein